MLLTISKQSRVKHKTYGGGAGSPVIVAGASSLIGGQKGVTIPKLQLSRKAGHSPKDKQGGQLRTLGHAYVGRPAGRVKGGDKYSEKWNNFTKVQLNPDKIRGK